VARRAGIHAAGRVGRAEIGGFFGESVPQGGPKITGEIFQLERSDDTIIVVPTVDLRELDYQRIEEGASGILDILDGTGIQNVVLDFYKTDYYGSCALGFFVKLWKRVRGRNGRMVFCNISDHEKEILRVTHLDYLWPICPSRGEALKAVKG
jgi:anti-anti-sigma factor